MNFASILKATEVEGWNAKRFQMVYQTVKIFLIILIIPIAQTESGLKIRIETIRSLFLAREAFWQKCIGFKPFLKTL